MKLIIDIAEEDYNGICNLTKEQLNVLPIEVAEILMLIKHGTPLDDIKKEIDEQSAMHMDGELYIRNFDVKWILEGNEVSE